MYRTILVPLDGSGLAEQAMPLAVSIVQRAHANLGLARVHQPVSHLAPGGRPKKSAADERSYLEAVKATVQATGGVSAESTLLEGPIAPALCRHAAEINASLMVMTTHGRGPLSRFWLGSTTDELGPPHAGAAVGLPSGARQPAAGRLPVPPHPGPAGRVRRGRGSARPGRRDGPPHGRRPDLRAGRRAGPAGRPGRPGLHPAGPRRQR